jgi:very-short-patch-repair endonuclease
MKQSEYLKSEKHKAQFDLARIKASEACKFARLQRIDEYNKNPRKCVFCDTPIPYGESKSKKFCGSSCSAQYSNKLKVDPGKQIKEGQERGKKNKICECCGAAYLGFTYQKYCSEKCPNKKPEKKCRSLEKKCRSLGLCPIDKKPEKKRKTYQNICKICKCEFNASQKKVKTCSKECNRLLLREIQLSLIENGTHKGWKSRSEPSYPEKFFMRVLKENGINYEFEKKVGPYFIDFAIGNFALEIDGAQHECPDRKESDLRKDEYLTKNGYSVNRIKWHKLTGKENSNELMRQKISLFLEKLNEYKQTTISI